MSLEDVTRHYKIDVSRMLDHVVRFPDQVEDAWRRAAALKIPALRGKGPVIICGMGGSGIGGKLLLDLAQQDAPVPLYLETGYALPSYAGPATPVVCVSYSGGTEEILSVFQSALYRKCPTIVVTSGGELAAEAAKAGTPILEIPGGMPPRAALGYLFTPLLSFASRWGICPVSDEELDGAVRKVRKLVERNSLEGDPVENRPLQLAKRLYGKTPIVYAGNGLLASVAYRWKTQFNENAKCMAFASTFPELGHNEIVGWDCPERLRKDFFLIVLRDAEDHPRVQKRMELSFRMLEPLAGGAAFIESEGAQGREGRIGRLLGTVLLGDFTSVFLAVEYGKDPTPIERIEKIKDELRSED